MKLVKFFAHAKTPSILTALMIGGVSLTALHTTPNPPLLQNTNNFLIFADQNIFLDENSTISSGDLGTNGKLEIGKDSTINGNLFADKIALDKNTSINGNASFNTLKNEGEILGTQTKLVSLPIANLLPPSLFPTGTEDRTFQGAVNAFPAGNYKNITLQNDSTLTLSGGTYNLNALDLQEHSTLVFTASTTINIQSKLSARDFVSVFNGTGAKFDDLHINYLGAKGSVEDGDIIFGKNSFLSVTLLAPKAGVVIGKDSILRGQILTRKILVGKGFVGSKEEVFSQPTDVSKIVTVEGEKFPVNEIVVVLNDRAVFSDAQAIANSLQGFIIGFIPTPQIYKIKVPAMTAVELDTLIDNLQNRNNPSILFVSKNIMSAIQ